MRGAVRNVWMAATLATLAGGAAAQDSVSRNADGGNGLPGDALTPWSAGVPQRAHYTADLRAFQGSWGTALGIVPLGKSGKMSAVRFNAFNGASAISQTIRADGQPLSSTFTTWSAAGGGVNGSANNPALSTSTPAPTQAVMFGVGWLDFEEVTSGANGVLANQAAGARVLLDPAEPLRLYVTRYSAALNSPGPTSADTAQFGLGAVNASGDVVFRADSFNSSGAAAALLIGDNFFRVRADARTTGANVISNTGPGNAAATDWPLVRSTFTHVTPGVIEGSPGRIVGADLLGNLVVETTPGATTATASHRPGTTAQRGGVFIASREVFAGFSATGVMVTRSGPGGGKNDSLSVFGLGSNGALGPAATFTLPAALVDACDAFAWPLSGGEFRHYDSQVLFRGGCGPASVGSFSNGTGAIAATLTGGSPALPSSGYNAVVVARFDPANTAAGAQWSVAAWVDPAAGMGKELLGDFGADGVAGTSDAGEGDGVVDGTDGTIGRLAGMVETTLGYSGPSISAPAFDSAGNVYFIASVLLKSLEGTQIVDTPGVALVRGIADPSTLCYRLEVILKKGDVFQGVNSARPYRIEWLGLADEDSIATASLWPGSVSGSAWAGVDTGGLPQEAPQHLGGLVLSARIVYDVDQDGQFRDPTRSGLESTSVDEAYNAVLYVGNITPPPPQDGCPPCAADFNGDDGVDDLDITAFFAAFEQGEPCADVNGDDGIDDLDISTFFFAFEQGC